MSTVGKVFIVLNLFMAALFLGYASTALAASDDLMTQLGEEQDAHEATKTDLNGQLSKLRQDLKGAEERADSLQNERDSEKQRADRAESDLRDSRSTVDSLTSSYDGVSASLSGLDGTLSDVESAKATFNELVQRFPDTEEAKDAKSILRRIG